MGGAHCYAHHANIITHDGNAKAQDVFDLQAKMAAAVKAKFGIDLVREVRLLGKFDRAAGCNNEGYW